MKWLYLLVNFCAFIVPFIFSFHPKLAFYKQWKYLWPAIALSAIPFLVWDAYFTSIGVWGFNSRYTLGFRVLELPIEEILFFVCIPYSCLFTYHCFSVLIEKDYFSPAKNIVTWVLIIGLLVSGLVFIDRLYPAVTFLMLAVVLILTQLLIKPVWLSRFYFSYMVLLIPFCLVNGVLTGTGLEEPVVWYNNLENLGIRILTIPVEDVFYGMLLILLNTLIYEYFRKRKGEQTHPHLSV
ncbi:MAG: lycopene cyclase domain protein [Sphingobacteriaceae bacterium]|jgi:lycopene cyclase domain-containing protein|nr:lycopene cyclase domain protein [Sphingobacteriaceae bacterium]